MPQLSTDGDGLRHLSIHFERPLDRDLIDCGGQSLEPWPGSRVDTECDALSLMAQEKRYRRLRHSGLFEACSGSVAQRVETNNTLASD